MLVKTSQGGGPDSRETKSLGDNVQPNDTRYLRLSIPV